MIDTPQITETTAQPVAAIHITIPREQIQEVMGPAFGEVFAAIGAQGIAPAGPTFSHHFRMDDATFDFEVGVVVASPIAPSGRVVPSDLPAKRVARTIFHGDYAELGPAWGEFNAWLDANGHTPAPDLWECYIVGPDSTDDPAKWQTELNRPLL